MKVKVLCDNCGRETTVYYNNFQCYGDPEILCADCRHDLGNDEE